MESGELDLAAYAQDAQAFADRKNIPVMKCRRPITEGFCLISE